MPSFMDKKIGDMTPEELKKLTQMAVQQAMGQKQSQVNIGGTNFNVYVPQRPVQSEKFSSKMQREFETGQASLRLNDFKNAIKAFEKVTMNDPDIAEGWLWLGMAYSKAGSTSLALDSFIRATKAFPGCIDAWWNAGVLYNQSEEYEKAYQSFMGLVRNYHEDRTQFGNAGLELIGVADKSGRWQQALNMHNEGLKYFPGDTHLWINRGYILRKMNNLNEALYSITYAQILGNYQLTMLHMAKIYQALAEKMEANASKPYIERAAYNIQRYYESNKTDLTKKDYDEIMKLAKERGVSIPEKYDRVPWTRTDTVMLEAQALEAGLAINPNHCYGWLKLADSYRELDQFDLALDTYKEVKGLLPTQKPQDFPSVKEDELVQGMYWSYLGMKDWSNALKFAQALVASNVQDPYLWRLLAQAQLGAGNIEHAETSAKKSIEIKADYWNYAVLANIAAKRGKIDDAIGILNRFTTGYEKHHVFNQMGVIYRDGGNKDKAREYFEKSLEAFPNFVDAKKNLLKLDL
jgi:tetratricopeptide (TPR) repeat protein